MKKICFFVIILFSSRFVFSQTNVQISETTIKQVSNNLGNFAQLDSSLTKVIIANGIKKERRKGFLGIFGKKEEQLIITKIGEFSVINNRKVTSSTAIVVPNETVPTAVAELSPGGLSPFPSKTAGSSSGDIIVNGVTYVPYSGMEAPASAPGVAKPGFYRDPNTQKWYKKK